MLILEEKQLSPAETFASLKICDIFNLRPYEGAIVCNFCEQTLS